MITLSSEFQAALNNVERYAILFFTFYFGSGTYGLWTGQGEILYNGLTYRGGGSILDVSGIEINGDGSVGEFTLSLSTHPDKGLTEDILATFYEEDYKDRPVVVQFALMNPATGEPIGMTTLLEGYLYEAPYTKDPSGARIDGRIVSQGIKLSEVGGKYRNDATQRSLDATDTSLVGIGVQAADRVKTLKWGQA